MIVAATRTTDDNARWWWFGQLKHTKTNFFLVLNGGGVSKPSIKRRSSSMNIEVKGHVVDQHGLRKRRSPLTRVTCDRGRRSRLPIRCEEAKSKCNPRKTNAEVLSLLVSARLRNQIKVISFKAKLPSIFLLALIRCGNVPFVFFFFFSDLKDIHIGIDTSCFSCAPLSLSLSHLSHVNIDH